MCRKFWLSFVAIGFLIANGQSQSTNPTAPKVTVILQGASSFIVLADGKGQQQHRLTTRTSGLEGQPALSQNGKLIAYSLAASPGGKSEVWIAPASGGDGTRVSSPDQDALTPAFAQADRSLLYVTSGFNGHYSPVARPRRHDFEINRIPIAPDGASPGATPIALTHQKFFDLRSLSVSDDGASFLISTTGYPIGDLFEEFDIASPDRIKKIFQPVVHGSPSIGVAYGRAAYVGMNIVFEAASEPTKGGNFDYNLYEMSGATGGNLVQLTHHHGLIDDLSIEEGKVWMLELGQWKPVKLPDTN
jgi:hypothetical protein